MGFPGEVVPGLVDYGVHAHDGGVPNYGGDVPGPGGVPGLGFAAAVRHEPAAGPEPW